MLCFYHSSKKRLCSLLYSKKTKSSERKYILQVREDVMLQITVIPKNLLQAVMSNQKFLYSAFYSFTSQDMMHLLEDAGVPLKTERGNRVFPVSDHSSDIIHGLERLMKKYQSTDSSSKRSQKSSYRKWNSNRHTAYRIIKYILPTQ